MTTTETPNRTYASPLVDVFENDAEYLLRAELPGVQEPDIELRYEGETLRLEAARTTDHRVFRRSFEVSDRIDTEAISAELTHGVLSVRLPKAASARARRIPVTVA